MTKAITLSDLDNVYVSPKRSRSRLQQRLDLRSRQRAVISGKFTDAVKKAWNNRSFMRNKPFTYCFSSPWMYTEVGESQDTGYQVEERFVGDQYNEEIIEATNSALESELAEYNLAQYCDVPGAMAFRMYIDGDVARYEMDFKKKLGQEDLKKVMDWISGQMSDGFGEGFEQRPVTTLNEDIEFNIDDFYSDREEDDIDEWIRDHADRYGNYAETIDCEIYVSFWFTSRSFGREWKLNFDGVKDA